MADKMEFSFQTGPPEGARRIPPETPLRIGILGDFSGRANRSEPEAALDRRRIHRIDCDTMDRVLAALNPQLRLRLGEQSKLSVTITFAKLDDFHPDLLFDRMELFQKLHNLRARLQSPDTFAAAAGELALSAGTETPEQQQEPAPKPKAETTAEPAATPDESGAALFDQLLGKPARDPTESPPAVQRSGAIDSMLRDIVGPYVVPNPDPRRQECLDQVNTAMCGRMRAILHSPDFQALEAAWRGVEFLLTRAELDEGIQVYLIDLSKAELAADLGKAATVEQSSLHRELVGRIAGIPGEVSWGLLVGTYAFEATEEDLTTLRGMAVLANRAGAPFIAAASLPGCASLREHPEEWTPLQPQAQAAWDGLREAPGAAFLGLAAQRFLLRLPYGRKSDSIERFAFEELSSFTAHGQYLWGNSAFLVALLLSEAYCQERWNFRAEGVGEVDGLPVHAYVRDDESEVIPCAEAWTTDHAAEQILAQGLMPVQSIRGRDAIRMHLQSLSNTSPALSGKWCS